jgi:protein-S-isoprenylcysteine O-methyltransferase Ste14
MRDETTFRLIFIIGFVTLLIVGLYHRLRADTGEKLDRRQEGLFVLFGLRSVALVLFVAMIVWLVYPAGMAWSSVPLRAAWRWLGASVAGLSMILKTWTFHSLGRNITDTVVTRQHHELVTVGPYRWMRHPFYTSFCLDVVGISLLTANWFILLTGGLVFAFLVVRTAKEEENLVQRFGDDYRSYMQRVGRFWPRL